MSPLSRALAIVFIALLAATGGRAQTAAGWGDLDALLFAALTESGTAEASFWLPDAASPEQATEAVGIVYEYIPGSAGNTSIAIGLFRKAGGQFALAGLVDGIFGQTPRDQVYFPDRIELTTTTLNEGDARCCPSGTTRWAIDRATLATRELP